MNSQYTEMVCIKVLTCIREMCKSLSILRGYTNNETEVRFAFGNPIVANPWLFSNFRAEAEHPPLDEAA